MWTSKTPAIGMPMAESLVGFGFGRPHARSGAGRDIKLTVVARTADVHSLVNFFAVATAVPAKEPQSWVERCGRACDS